VECGRAWEMDEDERKRRDLCCVCVLVLVCEHDDVGEGGGQLGMIKCGKQAFGHTTTGHDTTRRMDGGGSPASSATTESPDLVARSLVSKSRRQRVSKTRFVYFFYAPQTLPLCRHLQPQYPVPPAAEKGINHNAGCLHCLSC